MAIDDAALIPGFMDTDRFPVRMAVSPVPETAAPLDESTLLPELRNAESMNRVYARYSTSFLTLDEVAKEAGIDIQVVVRWARKGSWQKRRAELQELYAQDLQAATRMFADKERLAEIQSMLQSGQRLRDIITRQLNAIYEGTVLAKASEIKSMAEALVAASTVTSRAVGLSESGQIASSETAEDKSKKGKVPLVMIHIADAVRESTTINVTEEPQ